MELSREILHSKLNLSNLENKNSVFSLKLILRFPELHTHFTMEAGLHSYNFTEGPEGQFCMYFVWHHTQHKQLKNK